MRICVYGAGSVGGAMAARLQRSGTPVSVVARGPHGEAMRTRGVTLIAAGERCTIPLHAVVDDPSALPPQDIVVVTVKGPSLPAIGRALGKLVAPTGRVVYCMNGIPHWFDHDLGFSFTDADRESLDPGASLRTAVPLEQTVGGVIYSSNEVREPGVVESTSPRNRFIVGRPDGRPDSLTGELVDILKRAGYESWQSTNIRNELWTKMLIVAAAPPVASLTECALDQLTNDPGAFALMAELMREGLALGRHLGFELHDDIDDRLAYYRDKTVRPSMLQDFQLRRPPELESGILAFLAIARACGLDMPVMKHVGTLIRMRHVGVYSRAAA